MAKVLEFQLSFQRNPRTDLLSNGLVGSPCSPRDSQESSPTPQFKSVFSLVYIECSKQFGLIEILVWETLVLLLITKFHAGFLPLSMYDC